jgi:hypothetical protein
VYISFALSFFRIVRLRGKMLKILMLAWNLLFWKKGRMSFVLGKWCLFLATLLCIGEFVWKRFWSFIMKFINESIYWHGTCRFSNRLLHEALASARTVILTSENLPTVWRVTPENYSVFYNRVKLCVINRFEIVNIIFVKYKFKSLLFPFCNKFWSSFNMENTAWLNMIFRLVFCFHVAFSSI